MLTGQQIEQFVEAGAVTVDTPLTSQQIAAATATMDRLLPFQPATADRPARYRSSLTCSYDDDSLLDIIQHPFFEEVSQQALRADDVRLFQTAIVTAYPQPNTPWSFEQHVDIQYCLSDLDATPRRMICSFFLWLTDVNERRAPMMFRPGSHRLIGDHRERDPELRGVVPLVAPTTLAQLPALDYADPVPLLARAGQVSVLTTGAIHGASVNVDDTPRKGMVITFTAAGVEIGLPPGQAEQKRAYDQGLRDRLRPERRHIVDVA
jgi:hypothetical protein